MWMLVTLVLIGLFLVGGAIVGVVAFGTMRGGSPAAFFAVAGLFGLTMSIVYPVLEGGLMLGARSVEEGEGLGVGHLFAGFGHSGGRLALIGVFLLVGNLVIQFVVTLLLGAGLSAGMANPAMMAQQSVLMVLVYLALTLPLVMAFWFAPALVTFQEMSAFDALRSSFLGCLKNIVPFLVYGLAGLGLGIVIALLLGVVTVITRGLGILLVFVIALAISPIVIGSIYAGYRDVYIRQTAQ
jgi:hypothetical protein